MTHPMDSAADTLMGIFGFKKSGRVRQSINADGAIEHIAERFVDDDWVTLAVTDNQDEALRRIREVLSSPP